MMSHPSTQLQAISTPDLADNPQSLSLSPRARFTATVSPDLRPSFGCEIHQLQLLLSPSIVQNYKTAALPKIIMLYRGIIASLALASLTSGVLANPGSGRQGHAVAVAPGAVTSDGSCGKANGFTCAGSSFGDCCSVSGHCGSSISFCGEGCQRNYGSCGSKAIKSFADGAPLERLKNFFKSMGISRHHGPPGARNGTHHMPNGTYGARNATHPGHRGFHKQNGTHAGKPGPRKNVNARDAEAEVAPRCARNVGGEVSPRCEHDADGGVAPRGAQPTGTNHRGGPGEGSDRRPSPGAPPARPTGAPPSGTPPARFTGTQGPGGHGGRAGPPPSGTPPARPTGANGRGGPAGDHDPTHTGKPTRPSVAATRPARPT